MDKIRIVTRCTDGCKHCEWVFGSPRCLHSEMKARIIEDDPTDPCLYQKVPTDSRKFHDECPLNNEIMDRFEAEDDYNQCDSCKWIFKVKVTEFPCIKCCHNTIAE